MGQVVGGIKLPYLPPPPRFLGAIGAVAGAVIGAIVGGIYSRNRSGGDEE